MAFPLINPTPQFFDSSGSPLASGTIEFRNPSTDALINSYPTADDADAQTSANDNPLTLNARGEAENGLYLEDGVKYKVRLKDSDGDTVWTQDDVQCPYDLTDPVRHIIAHTTVTSSSGVVTLDLDSYNSFDITLTENVTSLVVTGTLTSGNYHEFNLDITQGASAYTFAFAAKYLFPDSSDLVPSTTAAAIDALHGYTIDGGTSYRCTFRKSFG